MQTRWLVLALGLGVAAAGCQNRKSNLGDNKMGEETGEPATSPGSNVEPGQETGEPAAGGQKMPASIFVGTVQDVSQGSLTVQSTDGTSYMVKLDEQTQLMKQGKSISSDQLKKGDHVRVTPGSSGAAARQIELLGGSSGGSQQP
jgi:hypothetical protein